jgi:hypothetical protein
VYRGRRGISRTRGATSASARGFCRNRRGISAAAAEMTLPRSRWQRRNWEFDLYPD